ncbi:AAA-ATPase-like domain-containing protein, partial [Jimgerdemannia flammicorona]
MLIDIRTTISKVYAEHRYLQEHLQDEEIIKFDRIVREDPSYPTLRHALGELSEYLARYHQQKCIVLIDEYDAPIGAAYHKGYYDDAMDFFRPMFSSLLKDNINLHKAFLVGVLRVGKSGFLSGLNNISVYPMTHPQFASSFGFTSDEVELLLTHHS